MFAVALSPDHAADACKGECPKGFQSVCVERNGNCSCECVKDARDGAAKLRGLLNGKQLSQTAVNEGVNRYRQLAGSSGEFSFELKDKDQTVTVSGHGFGAAPNSPKATASRKK
jgi:hypothetical protein